MESNDIEWSGCRLIEAVPGPHAGDPVFVGSRLPVAAVIENYDDFREDAMTPDEAVCETLEAYPSIPRGAAAIRAVVEYRASHRPLLQP